MELSPRRIQLFTPAERKGVLLAAVVSLALLLIFVGIVQAYKSVVPEHVERDTANITMRDYEQALAKWRARNVAEYTITVITRGIREDETHQITLRVVPDRNEVDVLSHLLNGSPYSGALADYPGLTVEAMFDTIEQRLEVINSEQPIYASDDDTDYYQDIVVRFDSNLGYPTLYDTHVRSAHESREIVWREPAQSGIEVKRLTIVR